MQVATYVSTCVHNMHMREHYHTAPNFCAINFLELFFDQWIMKISLHGL